MKTKGKGDTREQAAQNAKDILQGIANGIPHKIIANDLGMRFSSFRMRVRYQREKHGALNTNHLIAIAFRKKMIE